MALNPTQETKLFTAIRTQFPNDTDIEFALRIFRVVIRNNPSAAQKTILQNFIASIVSADDSRLATFDANSATQKAALQADRNEINGYGPLL